MINKRILCSLAAFAMVLGLFSGAILSPEAVYAEGEESSETSTEPIVVSDAANLYAALYFGGNYVLGADVDLTGSQYGTSLYALADTTLDLGEYNVVLPDDNSSIYAWGGNLTIKGGLGKIVKSVKNTDFPAVWAYQGDVTLDGGTIVAGKNPVMVSDGMHFTMNDGNIAGEQYGVIGYGASEIVINDGTISASEVAVLGHGAETGTKITINGGILTSEDTGIYLPQLEGVTKINGGLIRAGLNGVEIRAGSLEINGGEILVPTDVEYKVVANGSGTTTTGAAVSVAQHTTKQPISVKISGGEFTAPVAFSEANPQGNSEEDIAKVSVEITGGEFAGEIKSEDLKDFVTGGRFSAAPAEEDIIPGHEAEENNDGVYEIVPIKIDWKDNYLEELYDGVNALVVQINAELIADRKANLGVSEKTDLSGYGLAGEGELLKVLDVDMTDRDGEKVEVKDNDLMVYIDLSREDYDKISAYDEIKVVYFDEEKKEAERLEAVLTNEDNNYFISFNTTHLSEYGVVGVNNTSEATDDETNEGETSEGEAKVIDATGSTETNADAPETGTVTAAGASATAAALVTAVIIGLITSVASFVFLMRKH